MLVKVLNETQIVADIAVKANGICLGCFRSGVVYRNVLSLFLNESQI